MTTTIHMSDDVRDAALYATLADLDNQLDDVIHRAQAMREDPAARRDAVQIGDLRGNMKTLRDLLDAVDALMPIDEREEA